MTGRAARISGILHIDDTPVGRERAEGYELGPGRMVPQYLETLPNGRVHRIMEERGMPDLATTPVNSRFPTGHYFALGDSRDNLADSPVIGTIPAENLIGRARIVVISIDAFSIRGDGVFHGVEQSATVPRPHRRALTGMVASAYHRGAGTGRRMHGTS